MGDKSDISKQALFTPYPPSHPLPQEYITENASMIQDGYIQVLNVKAKGQKLQG